MRSSKYAKYIFVDDLTSKLISNVLPSVDVFQAESRNFFHYGLTSKLPSNVFPQCGFS